MFGSQIVALKKSITAANKIMEPTIAIDLYTDIIEEKLYHGKKTFAVAAILFLENDKRGDVYYRRACAYERLAKKTTTIAEALEYYQEASADMAEAKKAYEDFDKRDNCRIKIREIETAVATIHERLTVTSAKEKKRALEESSSDTASTTSPYHLRNIRMWSNSKKTYENRVDQMEKERINPGKKTKYR
jgi:hypothetical protein